MYQILTDIFAAVLPILLIVVGEYLRRLIARLADGFEERTAVQIEADARATLHSAIMTGIAAALARGLTGQAAIDAGIDHARGAGAADAIDHFALNGGKALQTLAESKLWAMVGNDLFDRATVEMPAK